MAETPLDPPQAAGDSDEVLEKLEALLGRARGPDSRGEDPPARAEIPTLDEPVHLTAPAAGLHAIPVGGRIPTLTEPVALPGRSLTQPVPDPMSRQTLRQRVESLLDPDLEQRLYRRALADLERTLIDVERGFRDELAAWRDEHMAQMRDQVRGEIERAVDEMVAELARQRGPGSR